ncbi:MAG TPA: efflux RND transporter periplasmic adaptor subunit [Allosphingosinicella sp.]
MLMNATIDDVRSPEADTLIAERLSALKTLHQGGTAQALDRFAKPAAAGQKGKRLVLGGLLAALLFAATVLGLALRSEPAPTAAVAGAAAAPVPGTTGEPQVLLNAVGYIEPGRVATVSAQVTGRIVSLSVEQGARVEAGQMLARLDTDLAAADNRIARSEVGAVGSRIAEESARLGAAQAALARIRSVSSDFVTKAAVEERETAVAVSSARLRQLQSEQATAQLRASRSDRQVDMYLVRAPFSGTITDLSASVGEIVSPISAGGGFVRTGIATIADMDSLGVKTEIPEQHLGQISVGHPVRITIPAYPGRSFRGEVGTIKPEVNRDSGTISIWVRLLGHDNVRILPNMRAQVDFLGKR